MRRIQTHLLLIVCAAMSLLTACDRSPKIKSVAEYLHDIDSIPVAQKQYKWGVKEDWEKNAKDENYQNLSKASNLILMSGNFASHPLRKCWPKIEKEKRSTANTDHACLDALGYTR